MTGTVVLDVDGVLLLGGEPIAGSGEAMAELEAAGLRLVVATNNATRTPAYASERIARLTGYRLDPSRIVTSTMAIGRMLRPGDEPVYPMAEPGMAETLRDGGVAVTGDPAAAGTVAVGLDRSFDYDRVTAAARAIHRGARFIASNTDATFPTPQGPAPGAGAMVAAVATASGVTPDVAGKPHRPMIETVAPLLADGPVWMVGDRPETDMAFAVAAGWTSVLALSGVTARASDVPAGLEPALVIDRLADLPALLAQLR
ncbi:MAG: HAD-IIA family hydrolase [Actinobacteria bacterium]|nr:HAD-IIA family hydrolase [Actinomycetota bacterium]